MKVLLLRHKKLHLWLLADLAFLAAFLLARRSRGAMNALTEGFTNPLRRALGAVLRGYDVDGNAIEVSARGWLARIFQHEYDHLQGTLYVDRLAEPYAAQAQQAIVERGWGAPGYTWTPGE